MAGLHDLGRQYEERHFPASRRMDLQGEGPASARERALRWIQSRAHESPGEELLLIVERGRRPGRPPSPVRREVEELLRSLEGKLIDWWQAFGTGSLAVRLARDPRMIPLPTAARPPAGEGRTPETASPAPLAPHLDIPEELLDLARQAAELRRTREGISVGLLNVVLRRVWIETQATAMERRIDFESALQGVIAEERRRIFEQINGER